MRKLLRWMFIAGMAMTPQFAAAQCTDNNTQYGTYSVSCGVGLTTLNTCFYGGEYALVNVTSGNTYTFTTCGDTDFDTQITLYPAGGGSPLGYNDDYCGTQSQVIWTATFTGQIKVLIDRYNCTNQSTCMTLNASCTAPTPPPPPPCPTNVNAGPDVTICSGQNTVLNGSATAPTVTLFSENFENCTEGIIGVNSCNWTEYIVSVASSYSFWAISDNCPLSGSKSMTLYDDWDGNYCDYDEDGFFSSPAIDFISRTAAPINAVGYTNLRLSFKWRCQGESGYDYGTVVWSTNGTTWNNVSSTQYYGQTTTQTVTNLDLSAANGQQFYLGFRWRNDASVGGNPPFTVDDIVVTGLASVTYAWSPGTGLSSTTVANPTASPTGTTTYTLTATSTNGCSVSDNVTVTVNTAPAQPSAIAGPTNFCQGSSTNYSVTNVPGVTYTWTYNGSPVGGSGNSITFSPSGSGTLSVTPTIGSCPGPSRTLTVGMSVMPGTYSTLPASQAMCMNNVPATVTATYVSGASGSVSSWQSSPVSNFASGVVSYAVPSYSFTPPAVTQTTYYRAVLVNGACTTYSATAVVTVTAPSGLLGNYGDSRTCPVNGSTFVDFYESAGGRLIASVNSNGQNIGNVTTTVYPEGGPVPVQACNTNQPWFEFTAMGRHWLMSSTIAPTNPISVRLYFDQSELTALAGAANSNTNPDDDIAGIGDLDLTKYNNAVTPSLENATFSDNCAPGATASLYGQTASGNATGVATGFTNATARFVQYSIPGFSELWLGGSSGGSPLPIVLSSFSAKCEKDQARIDWITASEVNNGYFLLEKSTDLVTWIPVAQIDGAGNSNTELSYTAYDERPEGLTYYRLTQIDYNGQSEIFNPVSVICASDGEESVLLVFPNPHISGQTFAVRVHLPKDIHSEIVLTDMTGRTVITRPIVGTGTPVDFSFTERLAPGAYVVSVRLPQGKPLTFKMIVR